MKYEAWAHTIGGKCILPGQTHSSHRAACRALKASLVEVADREKGKVHCTHYGHYIVTVPGLGTIATGSVAMVEDD